MNNSPRIFLGIDPGTGRTGWGVVKKKYTDGKVEIEYVAHGCIVTTQDDVMPKRLHNLHKELEKIIKEFNPECLIVEQLFFGRNTKTAISVGQARGVIMMSAGKRDLPLFEYTSISVKYSLSGNGRLDKKDIQKIVKSILGKNKATLSFNTKDSGFDDSADALAIAIHHSFKMHGFVSPAFVQKEPKKKVKKSRVKKN